MDAIQSLAAGRYLTDKGLYPKDIHYDMTETYGKDGPSYALLKKWSEEFRRGKDSIDDDPRAVQLAPHTQA
ncbi:hypothetical protein BaRGS_00016957, partial [Batillaria attramentaria]